RAKRDLDGVQLIRARLLAIHTSQDIMGFHSGFRTGAGFSDRVNHDSPVLSNQSKAAQIRHELGAIEVFALLFYAPLNLTCGAGGSVCVPLLVMTSARKSSSRWRNSGRANSSARSRARTASCGQPCASQLLMAARSAKADGSAYVWPTVSSM